MDAPDTTSDSGACDALRRSSRAFAAGSIRSIADVPFLFEADDPARAAVLADLATAWDPVPDSRADAGQHTVRFHLSNSALSLPAGPPDVSVAGLSAWRIGERLLVDDADGCRGWADAAQITIYGPAQLRSVEGVSGALLGHAFNERRLLTLHAAAFLLPDGGAVITTGPTGAGKSTLTAVALHQGWGILSDDLCVVRVGETIEVTGVPRAPCIPPEVASGLGGTPLDGDSGRARLRLPADVLQRGWHPVVAVLRSGHGDLPTSTLSATGPREQFDDLLRSQAVAVTPEHHRRSLQACAALSRLPGFALHHGRDPARRVSSAADCLDALTRAVDGATTRAERTGSEPGNLRHAGESTLPSA